MTRLRENVKDAADVTNMVFSHTEVGKKNNLVITLIVRNAYSNT